MKKSCEAALAAMGVTIAGASRLQSNSYRVSGPVLRWRSLETVDSVICEKGST